MLKTLFDWFRNRQGATAVEYSFIAGGIALACVAAIFLMGDSLQAIFNTMADSMASAAGKM